MDSSMNEISFLSHTFSPLSLSLSLCVCLLLFTSLLVFLESYYPKLSCRDTGENTSARRAFQVVTQNFPTFFPSTIQNKIVVQKEILCRNSDIPTRGIHCTLFPLSEFHSYLLITSCDLSYTGSQILPKDKNIFNHLPTRSLERISFSSAEHTWMIISCLFAVEADILSSAWGNYEMKCLTFHG